MSLRKAEGWRGLVVWLCLASASWVLASCDFFSEVFTGKEVNDVDIDATFTVLVPVAMPTQEEIDAAPVENGLRTVDIAPVYITIDLVAQEPSLATHRGDIKSVRVTNITHNVTRNTLDVTLQPIDIMVGPADGSVEDATLLAITGAVAPLTTTTQKASITEVGRQNASLHMSNLTFGVGAVTSLIVPEDYQTSGGSADTDLLFEVTVTANVDAE